jgi:hypothetical protein
MSITVILLLILLLPFLCKMLIVYMAYFQWALRVPPIKLILNLKKVTKQTPKKSKIGFSIPETCQSVTDKKK